MKKVFAILLSVYAFLLLTTSCGDLFSSSSRSIVGTWGMVSGGIKEGGSFSSLEEKEGTYYKTMVFLEDGTFTEQCGDATATGTYEVKSSSIKYSYALTSTMRHPLAHERVHERASYSSISGLMRSCWGVVYSRSV